MIEDQIHGEEEEEGGKKKERKRRGEEKGKSDTKELAENDRT